MFHFFCLTRNADRSLVDHISKEGFTPLHLAAAAGRTWCCKSLIVARAYVDARGGPTSATPLHLAATGGHTSTVRLLIAERAGIDIPDNTGRKPSTACRDEATRMAMQSTLVKTACHASSCTAEGPGLQPEVRSQPLLIFIQAVKIIQLI